MNKYPVIISIVMVVVFFTIIWILHRLYKRIARRCRKKSCGRSDVKRICKIILPPEESISYRSPEGKWRWSIRRPVKLTFTSCKCGWVELVKIDTDPISVWHAKWTERFHREQYYLEDWPLVQAAQHKIRTLYLHDKHLALDDQASDTPPLSLLSLFRDHLRELGEIIEKM